MEFSQGQNDLPCAVLVAIPHMNTCPKKIRLLGSGYVQGKKHTVVRKINRNGTQCVKTLDPYAHSLIQCRASPNQWDVVGAHNKHQVIDSRPIGARSSPPGFCGFNKNLRPEGKDKTERPSLEQLACFVQPIWNVKPE